MRNLLVAALALSCPLLLFAQTAEELVAKNLQARGGLEKIKAIKSLRMTGKLQQGSLTADLSRTAMAPILVRDAVTIQGMAQIQAYDGATGWQISPFEGRKDAEQLGEDDLRELTEEADFYGPLVDYRTKDNRIEYLGHDTVGVYFPFSIEAGNKQNPDSVAKATIDKIEVNVPVNAADFKMPHAAAAGTRSFES